MRNFHPFPAMLAAIAATLLLPVPTLAAPGDPVFETCPSAEDVGDNVECYPLTFTSKTEIHPDGIPIIGYLFVPKNRPAEPLPAIVFAHGSGSMYSDGNHNEGLNSKHKQWVKQYTSELGFVSLHVSSFHSRYLLPDTPGDQRILEIDVPPKGTPGGDDYRATSYLGGRDAAARTDIDFDPNPASEDEKWKDADNKGAGVSEVMERAYDMDAAWDFLAGIRPGTFLENSRNDGDKPTLGTPMTGVGYIGDIVTGGLVVDHERIFLYGTSHGGQAAMAAAHRARALGDGNPMNKDLPEGFDRRRYAAFFDYYGGCGLYGAYGGVNDSTWQPYAPFIIFAGEYDDTVFDDTPVDSSGKLEAEGCGKRIARARGATGFDEFLEIVVYDDAYHSFDGVEYEDVDELARGDAPVEKGGLNDWLAKIHANYRITVPFMDAVSRRVSAARNHHAFPSWAKLGFATSLADFDTVPLKPYLAPVPMAGSPLDTGVEIPIADLGNHQLDIRTLVHEPFRTFTVSCIVQPVPAGITESDECVVQFALSANDRGSLPVSFWLIVTSDRGRTLVPVTLKAVEDGDGGMLHFGDPFHARPFDESFTTKLADGEFRVPMDSLIWSFHDEKQTHVMSIGHYSSSFHLIEPRFLTGQTTQSTHQWNAYSNGNLVRAEFSISSLGTESAQIALDDVVPVNIGNPDFATQPLFPLDFNSQYTPLVPIDFDKGDEGDESGDSGDDLDNDHDGNDICDGDSEDGNADDDDTDDGDDCSDDEGNSNPTANPGGGGALFWLLPLVLLFRRRR